MRNKKKTGRNSTTWHGGYCTTGQPLHLSNIGSGGVYSKHSMELTHHEQQVSPPVTKSVRERVIAFHDRHILVAPIAEDAAKAFEHVAEGITSKKGKEVVEKIRPHIADWSKNAEVGAGVTDMVLGVAGSVVAAEGLIGGLVESRRAGKEVALLDRANQATAMSELKKDLRPRIKRGFAGAAVTGVFGGLRPVTRLTHTIGIPLARKIALTVDAIMLKKEQKLETKQVFVGRGKA